MLLDKLFGMLAYGELSNLSMATEVVGSIVEAKKPQLVHFCNEGLMRLYTKFIIKEKDCIIELVDGMTIYHLKPEFSATGFDPLLANYPYIRDTFADKFTGDVIKVLSVQNSWGESRPVNDPNNFWSVNTPTPRMIQVNTPRLGEVLSVSYQADHREVGIGTNDHKDIDLPETLYGALTAFIAYKVYFNMNTAESQAIAQGHLAMFDNICNDVTEADALNQSISGENTRFTSRGWK